MDKTEVNMNVLNKVIAFKLLRILRDNGFIEDGTAFYFSNCYGILLFASRAGSPPCHPERSGTTHQKSRTTTNHCRTVEPRPRRGASRRDLRC